MKIRKSRNAADEHTVLAAMVMDDVVCGRVASKWASNAFKSKWSNLVAGWCVKYYNKYEHAPKRRIRNLFERWAAKTQDDSLIESTETFLEEVSDEFENGQMNTNTEYVLDAAGRLFNSIHIERLRDDIEDNLEDNNPDGAIESITKWNHINLGVGEWIDPFTDSAVMKQAFAHSHDPLIRYPGDLGKFFGTQLERDGLISFEGPEKRGKTFWLMDMVFRAVLQRRRVAYYEVGDMSQDQIVRRMASRISRTPVYPGVIRYPVKLRVQHRGTSTKPRIEYIRRTFKQGLGWRQAHKDGLAYMSHKAKSDHNLLRLSIHPNDSLHVRDIDTMLKEWQRDAWPVDVVVIDYADILDMTYSGIEGRDRINQTWKDLRKISQIYHCLVITATQTDSTSYFANVIDRQHFSEDKRKRAHVTGSIGLNQTEEEKKIGIMRLNWVVKREGAYLPSKCVYVAGCPEIGNLAIRSSF